MRTPSIVRLVSAMLVASTILRRPGFAGASAASCSPARELAEQRQHVDAVAEVAQHALHAADFARAGQEHQHVARRFGQRALDRRAAPRAPAHRAQPGSSGMPVPA